MSHLGLEANFQIEKTSSVSELGVRQPGFKFTSCTKQVQSVFYGLWFRSRNTLFFNIMVARH